MTVATTRSVTSATADAPSPLAIVTSFGIMGAPATLATSTRPIRMSSSTPSHVPIIHAAPGTSTKFNPRAAATNRMFRSGAIDLGDSEPHPHPQHRADRERRRNELRKLPKKFRHCRLLLGEGHRESFLGGDLVVAIRCPLWGPLRPPSSLLQ